MIVYIYNIGVDLYNGFNGLRHRINWTYFTVLDGLAHPLYSLNRRKWEILKLCKLSIPRIRYFEKNFLFKFYQKISEEEVQSIYDQFLNSYKKEFK